MGMDEKAIVLSKAANARHALAKGGDHKIGPGQAPSRQTPSVERPQYTSPCG